MLLIHITLKNKYAIHNYTTVSFHHFICVKQLLSQEQNTAPAGVDWTGIGNSQKSGTEHGSRWCFLYWG